MRGPHTETFGSTLSSKRIIGGGGACFGRWNSRQRSAMDEGFGSRTA